MKTEESELLELQRLRRKRISKLKSLLTKAISIWIIFSFIAIIVLSVQVVRLSIKANKLEQLVNQMVVNIEAINSFEKGTDHDVSLGEVEDSQVAEDTQISEETQTLENLADNDNIDENIATEDDNHKVFLTFDCEPSENTYLILKYLKRNNIKATFFVSGDDSAESKAIIKKIVEDGHTIGMHSYSNRYSTVYASKDAFEDDLNLIYDYILDASGINAIYYRFPGGSDNEISNVPMTEFINLLNSKGYIYYDWNVSAGDSSVDYSVEDVVSNVTSGVKKYKSSVVLLHDYSNKSTTAEAISPLINELKRMNAEILPIDENTYIIQNNISGGE